MRAIGVGQELTNAKDGWFLLPNGEIVDWNGKKIKLDEEEKKDIENASNWCDCFFEIEKDGSVAIEDLEESGVDGYISMMASMCGGDVAIRGHHIRLLNHYRKEVEKWAFEDAFPTKFKSWADWNSFLWRAAEEAAREIEKIFVEEYKEELKRLEIEDICEEIVNKILEEKAAI